MRAIVPAAGRGRRLEPATLTTPKPLLPVAGRPILAHVLDALAGAGIRDVVVVVGHLGDQIAAYLETRSGPRARVVVQSPLGGNGDAVRAARDYLDGPLLVAFGDTILCGDLSAAVRAGVTAIAVARVEDGRSYGIVETDDGGWVRRIWEKPAAPPSHDAVAGTFVFAEGRRLREALDEMAGRRHAAASPPGEVWLTDVVQRMIDRGERVRTFRVDAFYDCGTPERLAAAERALRAAGGPQGRGAGVSAGQAGGGRRAVFLDRDGVLIRDVVHLTDASQIEILPGAPAGVRRLHRAGWMIVVVTNQSVVARGMVSEDELRRIHDALESRLLVRGAALDAIYYCPHHPEGAIDAYRVVCDCRKPAPGLLLRAASDLGIDLRASVMIGDAATDVEAGRRAGCRTVRLHGPAGEAPAGPAMARGRDADHVAADLAAAADWILAEMPASSGQPVDRGRL